MIQFNWKRYVISRLGEIVLLHFCDESVLKHDVETMMIMPSGGNVWCKHLPLIHGGPLTEATYIIT